MKISYIFPSRERPAKFFACLDNLQDQSFSDNYMVIAKLDNDDPFKSEYEKRLHEYPEVTVKWGLSKNKVDAVNRSLEDLPECDIIVLWSDDMHVEEFAFDDEIRKAFATHFPNLDGVVHFPEEKSAERTMVLTIMGINLYKQLGYLYHPSYESVYCDNDLTEMTRLMGKYVFVNKRMYSHRHPIFGRAEWDEQYRRTESQEFYKKDGHTFNVRKANKFGL